MEQGWDPDVKKYFRKILNSISYGLIWMLASATAGLYFELGYTNGKPLIYTIIFYVFMLGTLALLVRYLYKIWKND
jgi:hypothetical protein